MKRLLTAALVVTGLGVAISTVPASAAAPASGRTLAANTRFFVDPDSGCLLPGTC